MVCGLTEFLNPNTKCWQNVGTQDQNKEQLKQRIMLTSARVKLVGSVRSVRPGFRKMSEQVQAPKRDVLGIVFFSGICVLAGGLGVWQTQRYLVVYSRSA